MRAMTEKQKRAIASGHYAVHSRLWVKGADEEWVNLSDLAGHNWFIGFDEHDHHVDSPIRQFSFYLWRNRFDLSLSAFMQGSRLNLDAMGVYRPLLDLHREYRLEVAIVPEGAPVKPEDWFEFARGRIDKILWANPGPELEIIARDQAGELQDTWIEEEREYGDDEGDVLAHEVIRSLLDDNGWGHLGLWLPDGPSPVSIRRYRQQQMPLLQAIVDVAMQATWKVGFRWDESAKQWRFAFYDPKRDKTTPDHTFGPSQYLDVRDLSIDKAGIRNVVEVVYYDDDGERRVVRVQDDDSIARYGRRFMGLAAGTNSQIYTLEDATRYAMAALSDVAWPHADQEIEMLFWPFAELTDLYRWLPNGVHYDIPQELAVVSIRHTCRNGQTRTWIRTRGKPAGAYKAWHLRETRRGVAPANIAMAKPTGLQLQTGIDAIGLDTTAYILASWQRNLEPTLSHYRVRYRRYDGDVPRDWQYITVPAQMRPEHKISPLPGNMKYGVQVAAVSRIGEVQGPWSDEVTITTARDQTAPATPTGLTLTPHLRGVLATIQPNQEPDLARYEWQVRIGAGSPETIAADMVTSRLINAPPGSVVEVRVRAVDTSGNESPWTDWATTVAGNANGVVVVAASDSPAFRKVAADLVCDGTNDHEEIQQALDLLHVGGKVILLEGTYYISDEIKMPGNTTLAGQGAGTVLKIPDGFERSAFYMIREKQENTSGMTVQDLALDGNKENVGAGTKWGIRFHNCSDCTITGIHAYNFTYTAIGTYALTMEGTSGHKITNCVLRDNGGAGIVVQGGENHVVANNVVRNNDLYGPGPLGGAIYLSDVRGVTVSNNVSSENARSGIYLVSCENCVVANNVCTGNARDGIALTQSSGNNINGNTCQFNGEHGINIGVLQLGDHNNTITGNYCEGNSQSNHQAFDNIFIGRSCNRNNVQSNLCRMGNRANKPGYGIRVSSGATGNLVTNNDLFEGGSLGAFRDDGTGTVTTAGNRT